LWKLKAYLGIAYNWILMMFWRTVADIEDYIEKKWNDWGAGKE